MEMKFWIFLVAALVPMIMGFIWYHPKVMGKVWMDACGFSDEDVKGGNMPLIFGLSYLFSIMIGLGLYPIVVHQLGLFSMLQGEPGINEIGSEVHTLFSGLMDKYGTNFRTFKHGAFHGTLTGLFLALPILATNSLFEKKGFKYIAVNSGYWIITLALMGGVICQWA